MCATATFSYAETTPKLVLMDFDIGPWSPEVLQISARRLDELCEVAKTKSRTLQLTGGAPHVFLHVQDQLVRPATYVMQDVFRAKLEAEFMRARMITRNVDVIKIDPRFLADPARLVLGAAGHVSQGEVKMSQRALAQAEGKPLLGSLALRPGEDVTSDPLQIALLIGIAQLDNKWSDAGGAKVSFKQ